MRSRDRQGDETHTIDHARDRDPSPDSATWSCAAGRCSPAKGRREHDDQEQGLWWNRPKATRIPCLLPHAFGWLTVDYRLKYAAAEPVDDTRRRGTSRRPSRASRRLPDAAP